jgi:hypothetical protein
MDNLIHYHPDPKNGNVRCLNGSAHAHGTTDITKVTCPKCLDKKTCIEYWTEKARSSIFIFL